MIDRLIQTMPSGKWRILGRAALVGVAFVCVATVCIAFGAGALAPGLLAAAVVLPILLMVLRGLWAVLRALWTALQGLDAAVARMMTRQRSPTIQTGGDRGDSASGTAGLPLAAMTAAAVLADDDDGDGE